MRILVVDDDRSTRVMLRLLLSRRPGWRVESAADARRALALLRRNAYDWLLVDGQIEPFDGLELAARARALRPGLRIAMISGVYDAADAAGSGVERLFPKPLDADHIISYLGA